MNDPWLYSDQNFFVFRDIIEQIADHVMVTDRRGFIEYVNPAFEKTTGYSKEEVLGKNPRILQSGKQTLQYYQELWGTILAGKVFYARTINKKKNGQLYVVDQTVSLIRNEFKEISHFVFTWKDITETVRNEERLRFERDRLQEVIGFDEQLIRIRKSDRLIDFVVDKVRKILKVEKCSLMLIDRETNQLYAKSMAGFPEDAPMRIGITGSIAEKVVFDDGPLLVNDVGSDPRLKNLKQPSYLGSSFMIVPVKVDQNIIGVINAADKRMDSMGTKDFDNVDLKILSAIAIEMAVAIENVSFYKELNYLTVTDPLTHMHNYRYFVNRMDYELKRLKRFHGDLSLLMADIDGFKSFNDDSGHLAGDDLLKRIGQIMHLNSREVDVLCRYGEDEFAIIFPGTNKDGAIIAAERIRKCIEMAKFKKNVTLSFGIAQFRGKMTRYDLTFKADRAMHQAKNQGKNRVCIF